MTTYERFERAQGVSGIPLRIENVSGDTSQANAYAFGLGPSATIVLWDTLLDGRFTPPEVHVVLAHEIGHQSSEHIPEAVAWFGLFALAGGLVLVLTTRHRGGMGEPRAVPLALFVAAVFQLAVAPAQNVISRQSEAEADWKALQTTHNPAAARGLFREFAVTSLGDPSPATWAYVLLQTHPTLAQRVAMANAWAARQRQEQVSDRSRTPVRISATRGLDPVGDDLRDRERRGRPRRRRVADVDDAVGLVEDEVVEERPVGRERLRPDPRGAGEHVADLELGEQLPRRRDEAPRREVARQLAEARPPVPPCQAPESRRAERLAEVRGPTRPGDGSPRGRTPARRSARAAPRRRAARSCGCRGTGTPGPARGRRGP